MASSALEIALEPAPAAVRPGHGFDAVYCEHFGFVWRCLRGLGLPPRALEDAAQDVTQVALFMDQFLAGLNETKRDLVIALCQGERPEGPARAADFAVNHPSSVYLKRVEQVCAKK